MGMQVHVAIADIEAVTKIIRHSDPQEDDGNGEEQWYDHYIVINEGSHYISCDAEFKSGWFDIGFMSEAAMNTLQFLIRNRICFSAS